MLSFLNCTRTKSFNVTETTTFNMKYLGFCEAPDEKDGLDRLVAALVEDKTTGKMKRGKKCHITLSQRSVQIDIEKEPSKELHVEYICYCAIDTKNTNMCVLNYVEVLKPKKQFQCHVLLGKNPHDVNRLARLTAEYHQEACEDLKKEFRREEERRQLDKHVHDVEKKMDETEVPRKNRDENQNTEEVSSEK